MVDDLERAELRSLVRNLDRYNWFGCLKRMSTLLISLGYPEAGELVAQLRSEAHPDCRQDLSELLRRQVEKHLCDSNWCA